MLIYVCVIYTGYWKISDSWTNIILVKGLFKVYLIKYYNKNSIGNWILVILTCAYSWRNTQTFCTKSAAKY